jgi:hypothetical protein
MNKQFVISFLCGVMLVAGTACKNENTPEDKTVQKRHLTIKMNDSAASPKHVKNATITNEGSTLLAEWKAEDAVSYCNLSRPDTYPLYIGTMTAASSGVKSDLNGDVTCTADDYLAVVYPSVDMSASSYEVGDGIHGRFTISLAGQDGTLSTLATHYHCVYGRAHVESVTGTTATATMDKMQSLLTICKFSFKDKATDAVLPINTLTISYGGAGSDAGKYPQSANVEVTNLTTNTAAQAVAVAGSTPLTINAGGATEVYVALLPENAARVYNFTVTNSTGTYSGTAEAHLKKGEYVPATGLKLTKQ